MTNYRQGARSLALAAALGLSTAVAAYAQSTCDGAELIEGGKLHVAFNGDMPGTGVKDGKLTGIDGSIMANVAARLGLEVVPEQMEWSAEIESVKSRRVDIMHGMMGWGEARSKVITMTEPIYYSGALMTQLKGAGIKTLEDLKGKRIGTQQGFGWVPELQSIAPDLMLYDTSDAALRDLAAGRVDVLFLDPPLIRYAETIQPELNIESIPVVAPFDPALSQITDKYQVVFGMSKDAPKLEACINAAIKEIWANCENIKAASNFGFGDKYWFSPPSQPTRRGIDRPADWTYPELGACN